MGWLILALAVGFAIGSFFPQPALLKGWYDSAVVYIKDFRKKD